MFVSIFKEIRDNRWLIFQLFKRDFTALYKQSLLGILWAFVIPIVAVGTFVLLNSSGVFNVGDIAVPYPLYAVLGIAFWQLFSAGLIASSNSLVLAGSMITKINVSKKSLVIASTGQALVSFVIQFGVAIVLMIGYMAKPSVFILAVPLLIIPILLMMLGLGFTLSLLNGVIRDIGNVLSVVMTFLLFLTPILYAKPSSGALATISSYNPLYYLVSVPRSLILTGTTTEWGPFALASALSLVIFILCLCAFHLAETRIAERV
jgi:lipopolysaccharide transport system permease protein